MEAQTRELFPGVRLTMIRSDSFPSGFFSAHLLRSLRAGDAVRSALLMHVLRRGTRKLPEEGKLSAVLEGLRGSTVEPSVFRLGETMAVGLRAVFPDERILPAAENCLPKIIALCGEMLLDPATRGGLLRDDYVRSEGQKLHDRMEAERNDAESCAFLRAEELLLRDLGIPSVRAEEALRVRYQPLTRFYREVLRTSPMELFYCGSAHFSRVEEAVRRAFMTLPGGEDRAMPEYPTASAAGELHRVTEEEELERGYLILGFRYPRRSETEDPTLAVFGQLFGGSSSRLNRELKDQRSLCRALNSSVDRYTESVTVTAELEAEQREEAEEAILSELRRLSEGEISTEELASARKNAEITYLRRLEDPSALCEFRMGQYLLDAGGDLRQYAALASEVRPEDVAEIASRMRHSLTFFRGKTEANGEAERAQ